MLIAYINFEIIFWIYFPVLVIFTLDHMKTREKYNLEISLGDKITLLGESITHAPMPHMLFGNFTM